MAGRLEACHTKCGPTPKPAIEASPLHFVVQANKYHGTKRNVRSELLVAGYSERGVRPMPALRRRSSKVQN